jgi:hypothetical protein
MSSDSDSEGLTGFLNTQEKDGEEQTFKINGRTYELVQVANPVNWTGLAKAIALSGIATVSLGIQSLINRWADGVTSVIDGLVSFVGDVNTDGVPSGSGLIGKTVVPLLKAYRQDIWTASIDQFGIFGYPVAVAFTLLSVFLVIRGLQEAASRLAGGS